ncbi:MAG: threonine-phosphate decarboxylase CobD [Thermodesulfobacteriota bacterium]
MTEPLSIIYFLVMKIEHGGDIWGASQETGQRPGDLVDFSSSINPEGPAPAAREAIMELIDNERLLAAYPDPCSKALHKALGSYLGIKEESILAGNGSTQFIYLIPEVLRPGRALIVEPAFSEYAPALARAGSEVIPFLLKEDEDFAIDPRRLKKALLEQRPQILYIANPSNPVGRLREKENLLKIAGFCREKNIRLLIDEAFIDFNEDHSMAEEASQQDHIIVLRSMTKFFGLAALRLGYMVGARGLVETFRHALATWSINSAAAVAGVASLGDSSYISRTRKWLKREGPLMREGLMDIAGLKVYDSAANFFTVRLTSGAGYAGNDNEPMTAPRLKDLLLRKGLLIRDLSNIRGLGEDFFRVALKNPVENRLLLRELKAILGGGDGI